MRPPALSAVRLSALGPVAFGVVSIAAAVHARRQYGHGTPTWGGLLYNPAERARDLFDPLEGVRSGHPFARFVTSNGIEFPAGINYPPGSVGVFRAIDLLPMDLALLGIALLVAAAIGLLVASVALQERSRAVRIAMGLVAFTTTVVAYERLNSYSGFALESGAVALVLGVAGLMGIRIARDASWAVTIGAAFPVAFALDRMNIDCIVFALMSVAGVLYLRERRTPASIVWGAAIAIKLYPFLLFVIEPHPRRYRRMGVIAMCSVLIVSALGIALTDQGPVDVAVGFNDSLQWVETNYIIGPAGMTYGASLFTGIKGIAMMLGSSDQTALATSLYAWWKWGSVALLIAVAGAVYLLRLPTWSRLMVVTTSFLVLSPISADYRVIILLLPIAWWLRAPAGGNRSFAALILHAALAVVIGVTLAPKTFWIIAAPNITTETVFGPLLLTLVLLLAMARGLCERHNADSRRSPT